MFFAFIILGHTSAFATDPWLTSEVKMEIVHADLLRGSKTTVSRIDAVAYILESATAGKLVIDGHNYSCDGAGKGKHIQTGITS